MPIEWSAFQGNAAILIFIAALAGFGLVSIVTQLVTLLRRQSRRPVSAPAGALPLAPEISFRQFFIQNTAAMLLIEPGSGAILDANHAAESFYGSERAALQRSSIYDIIQLSPEEIERSAQQALAEQCTWFTFPHLLTNGDLCMVEAHFSPLAIDGKQSLCITLHDITDRIQAEEALKTNEAYYHALKEGTC